MINLINHVNPHPIQIDYENDKQVKIDDNDVNALQALYECKLTMTFKISLNLH